MSGAITVRRAEATDLPALVNLFHNARKSSLVIPTDGLKHGSSEELVSLHLHRGYLNVCATRTRGDGEEEIVTFLSFDSSLSESRSTKISTDAYIEGMKAEPEGMTGWNTVFLVRFVTSTKDCNLGSILRTVFLTLPMVDFIVLSQEREVLAIDEVAMKFAFVGASEASDQKVFVCNRQQFVKSLQCRVAKVEDYDDLVSIFNEQSEVIVRRYGEFFLAEVIEGQTESRKAVVALVDNRAVGLMCVTADLDVDFLNAHFDLKEFGYLKQASETQESEGGNCFAIILFGIDHRHASRAFEMMKAAFELFPDKEFCSLSLPHDIQETALTPYFSYAPPMPLESNPNGRQANFSHALYLFHRDSIRTFDSGYMLEDGPEKPWWVGGSQLDIDWCQDLEGLAVEVEETMGKTCDWLRTDSQLSAYAIRVLGTLVGIVAVQRRERQEKKWIEDLQEGYDLARDLSEEDCVVLRHVLLNPIFFKSARRIYQFIMQDCSAICLLYKLLPSEVLPTTVSEEFAQVRPRSCFHDSRNSKGNQKSTGAEGADGDYALFALWKSDLSLPSYRVSTRVVVGGASEAGLALLHELLLVRHICFKNLILVTPGSVEAREEELAHLLSAGSCSGPMSRLSLGRTGILSQVRSISGKIVGLSKGDNVLYLSGVSGDSELCFDKLVLATGKSTVELPECLDVDATPNLQNMYRLESDTVHASHLYTALKKSASLEPVEPVIVYGCALESLSVIALMLEMGKPGDAITLVLHKSWQDLGFDKTTYEVVASKLRDEGVRILKESRITDAHVADGEIHSVSVGDGHELSCSLLLLAAERGVDESVCRAVNEGGAVYDAGVVVDENLETVRSGVYAIGPVARFSRKCADAGRGLADFDSVCISACAAKALLQRIDPLHKLDAFMESHKVLSAHPDFVRSGWGQLRRLRIAEARLYAEEACCRGSCSTSLLASLKRRYETLVKVAALIPRSANVHTSCLESLVGIHVSFLNDVEGKLDRGDIPDLLHFFTEDWAAALRHDEFNRLIDSIHTSLRQAPDRLLEEAVQALQQAYQSEDSTLELRLTTTDVLGVGGESLNAPDAREAIETDLAKFLRQHRSVLDMYTIERC